MAVLTFPLYNHTSKPRIWQSRRGHDFFAWNISTLTVLYVLLTQGFASLITQKNIIGTSIDDLQTKIACRREANVIMEECLGSRIKPEGSAGIPGKDRLNIFNPIKSKEEDEKEIQSKDKFDGPSQNMDLQEDLITNAIHKAFHRSHLETPEGFEEEKFAEVRKEILESWNQFADFVKRNSNTHPGEKGLKKFQHQSSNIDLKAKKDGSWLSLIEDIHRNIKSLDKMGNKGNTKVEFILNDIIVLFISLVERFDLADRKELGNFLNSEEGQDLIANYSVGKFIEKYPSSLTSLYINYDYEETLKNSPFTQEIHGILREMDHDSFKYITWLLVEAEVNNQKSNMNLRYLNQMQKDLTQIVKRDHMNLSNKWVNQKKMEFFTEELMEHIYNFKIYNNEFTDEMKTEAAIMHKMLHFLMKYYVESKEVDIIDKIQNSKHYPSMLEFDKAMWSMSESLKSLLSKYQELNQLMTVHPQSKKILNPDYINIYSLADMNNGIKKTLFSEEHEKNYNFELTSLKNRNEEIGVMIEDLFTKWQRRDKMINDQLVETKIDLKDKAPISWLIRKLDGQSFLLSQFWRNDWHVMKKYPDTILLYSSEALKNVMRDIFGNPQNFI